MNSPQRDSDAIPADDAYDESEIVQTQPITQPQSQSQPTTQPTNGRDERHLWGYLMPCSPDINRVDFFKLLPRYEIGRDVKNKVVLPGAKISELILSGLLCFLLFLHTLETF